MKQTPEVVNYTPALLKAVCKSRRITKRKYRLVTLKRVQAELTLFLESPSLPIHEADREVLVKLRDAVRLAIGQERS